MNALLRSFSLDPLHMLIEVSMLLGLPLAAGMFIAHRFPAFARRVHAPMRNFSLLVLVGFVVGALVLNWSFFLQYGRFVVVVVFVHNALALAGGYGLARASGLSERDCRAVAFETGIQNSGLGLVLVFNFFGGLGGMAIVTAWWGIWHIVAGMALSTFWMRRPPLRGRLVRAMARRRSGPSTSAVDLAEVRRACVVCFGHACPMATLQRAAIPPRNSRYRPRALPRRPCRPSQQPRRRLPWQR